MPSGNPNIYKYGFGARPRKVDDEYRSRMKGVPRKHPWTKEKCVNELNDLLDILKKILKDNDKIDKDNPKKLKQETVRDCITLMNKILDFVKYLYPLSYSYSRSYIRIYWSYIINFPFGGFI